MTVTLAEEKIVWSRRFVRVKVDTEFTEIIIVFETEFPFVSENGI